MICHLPSSHFSSLSRGFPSQEPPPSSRHRSRARRPQQRRHDELINLAQGSSDGLTRASRGDRIVAAEAPCTEVESRSGVCVCVCVSGSDCVSVIRYARGRCPRRGVTSLPGWIRGHGFPELTGFCVSPNFFASGGRSAAVFVRVFRHVPFVELLLCSLVSFHPF